MKLQPGFKDYLWGGHRLVDAYHKKFEGEKLAESWELSCYPDCPSTIMNGKYAKMTLPEYLKKAGETALGTNCRRFSNFPVLVKLIDAKQSLSIQVHPDNAYALKNEGEYGKTEMWYIVEAEKDAFLYYGFEHEISKEEFKRRIEENTLTDVLHKAPVQKGDVFFIESGTLHAIGKGIVIAEIQQNSNITYRIYDYGRKGKDGKTRELHIDKALEVTKRTPVQRPVSPAPHIGDCDYFTVDKLFLDGKRMKSIRGCVSEESFVNILFLEGEGTIRNQEESLFFQKGDSFFMPAGSGEYEITGNCEALVTSEKNIEK